MISMRRSRRNCWRFSLERRLNRKIHSPRNQPHPGAGESNRENRADHNSAFSAFSLLFHSVFFVKAFALDFSRSRRQIPGTHAEVAVDARRCRRLRTVKRVAALVAALEPAVSNCEYERRVVSGVVTPNAGIGQMSEGGFGGERAARLHKHLRAECQPLREIYGCGVTWRDIAGGTHRAAHNRDVRRIFIPPREIPLPDRRPDAGAVPSSAAR